jgi:hypothetical protein
MAYTDNVIYWGEVIHKQQFRAATWLQTSAVPEFLTLFNGKFITTHPGSTLGSTPAKEIHLPINEISIFHVTPPEKQPVEFDPNEPNMKNIPVMVHAGNFLVEGQLRLSAQRTLTQYLENTHETFYSVYFPAIHCLSVPAMGVLKISYAIIRIKSSTLTVL